MGNLIKTRFRVFLMKTKSFLRRNFFKYPVIYDVKKRGFQKRALLIYLVPPFLGKVSFLHHNERRNLLIAEAFDELGFSVDVMDTRTPRKVDFGRYEIIFSVKEDMIVDNFKGKKIWFGTGMHHTIRNRNIIRRYEKLNARRGVNLKPKGLIPDEEMPYVKNADYIIALGNDTTVGDYRKLTRAKKVYMINNHFYKETPFLTRNFSECRKNFMFISSYNPVRGGLDLLLEIFPKYPEMNLFVFGLVVEDREFCKLYRKELFHTKNIHYFGFADIMSEDFFKIAKKCAFVIVPTCAEGQSSSVVQVMATGMIPIVTKESGIDVEKYEIGFNITDDIQEIENVINTVVGMDPGELEDISYHIRKVAEENFSEDAFKTNLKKILQEICAE